MSHIEMLKDVPDAQVATIKSSYEQEGASVVTFSQGNNLSTIIATFPDAPISKTAQKATASTTATKG